MVKKDNKHNDKGKKDQDLNQKPSTAMAADAQASELFANLELIGEVFELIEKETAEIADMIFDYLINIDDHHIAEGTIPPHDNKKINTYLKILNRLFLLSRKDLKFRIINRKTVENLDKKTFAISMCLDGGHSLDILCDIVNTENQARMPSFSPVKITIKKVFGNQHSLDKQ
ncbi:MAG: hypothetical protein ISQ34_01570 [Rickettsiales bacterium]|nr:hypothetical protein [Rickettsiales bacterium]